MYKRKLYGVSDGKSFINTLLIRNIIYLSIVYTMARGFVIEPPLFA
jgi:hypothetical protein